MVSIEDSEQDVILEENELIAVLRKHNRAQRNRNKQLRRVFKESQSNADHNFATLCDIEDKAQAALGVLWARGGFDCGPEDYDAIVEGALAAITLTRELAETDLYATDQE